MPCPLPRRTRRVRASVASPSARPSPKLRRVGVRDFTFEMLWGGRWRDVTIVAGSNAMERPMAQQLDDLSRSLTPLEQDSTIIAVIEMSQASWLVAGLVPGIERHPLKKLEPSEVELLRLFMRWRAEATQNGRTITRIVVAFEAGRDGFWLARWLRARNIKAGSCWVSGWWVWVVRSEGIWCDGCSASRHPARARSFCHHGCTGPGQPLRAAGRRQVLRLRAPAPLARGRALPRLRQRGRDPGRM